MPTSITGQGISIYPAPDDALSSTSKNPVQNKVIDEELSDVKNAISQLGDISAFKAAILQIAQKVAYIDEHGQDYYDDLFVALYPGVRLSAVFDSGSNKILTDDTLDTLKQYLTVTYYDGTTSQGEVVTDYTLSGTLQAGENTITVSYQEAITSFVVTAHEHQQITGFAIGMPYYHTTGYTLDTRSTYNNRCGADISNISIAGGDVLALSSYDTYKFASGTNDTATSTDEQRWIGGGYSDGDLELTASTAVNAKVVMITRLDNANLTQADVAWANANMRLIKG